MPVIHIFYCSGVDIRRLDDPGQNIVGEIMLYQKQTCRQKKHEKQPVLENPPDPVQTPEPDISPTEALFGPESSGTAPGAFHNAQDEAMLFYEDDDDES